MIFKVKIEYFFSNVLDLGDGFLLKIGKRNDVLVFWVGAKLLTHIFIFYIQNIIIQNVNRIISKNKKSKFFYLFVHFPPPQLFHYRLVSIWTKDFAFWGNLNRVRFDFRKFFDENLSVCWGGWGESKKGGGEFCWLTCLFRLQIQNRFSDINLKWKIP